MNPSILSLIPPIVLFIIACITGNILKAFASGIAAALLIIAHANPILMIDLLLKQVYIYFTDLNVIMLFLFLIGIGSIISILSTIQERVVRKERSKNQKRSFIKTARMGEYTSMLLSFLFSIDDYLSILTVGFLANQFAKKFVIPKERIAYFVHALSGPLVILIPISSWAAEIVSQLYQAGVHANSTATTAIASDPLFLYAQSMGYNFYSILTIFSVWFFVQSKIDMLPTSGHKTSALQSTTQTHIPALDIAIPLVILLASTFIGLLYTGDCFVFGGSNSIFTALSLNHSTFYVLFISSFIALVSLFFYELKQENVRLFEVSSFVSGGFNLMKNAIALVSLASIFSAFVRRDLMTGVYLANTLLVYISHSFIPFAVFVTSLLVALATGTSWGTFALMIPLIIQMLTSAAGITYASAAEQIPFLLPSLGAIFSGGVCGDHISPFSETTVMTATVTEISPLQHSKSQIIYALPAIISTTLLFLLIGIMPQVMKSLLINITVGCLLCLIFIFFVKYFVKRHANIN